MSIGAQSQSDRMPTLEASRQKSWLQKALHSVTSVASLVFSKFEFSSSEASKGLQRENEEGLVQFPQEEALPLPLQVSRKLQMEQGSRNAEDFLPIHSKDAPPSSWSHVSSGGSGNSLARELFLHRFDGSPVNTVFAPGEYHIPE